MLKTLWAALVALFSKPAPVAPKPVTSPSPQPTQAPVVPVTPPTPVVPPKPVPAPTAPILFDTPQNAYHAIRVLCDNAGLSLIRSIPVNGRLYLPKDIICATIGGESQFYNYLPNGNPTKHQNIVDGKVSSTDWGLCQINDFYHIGAGKDFPSVDYVMANPAAAVNFMIEMYKAGKLDLWDAYLNGSYKNYL